MNNEHRKLFPRPTAALEHLLVSHNVAGYQEHTTLPHPMGLMGLVPKATFVFYSCLIKVGNSICDNSV